LDETYDVALLLFFNFLEVRVNHIVFLLLAVAAGLIISGL